MLAGSIQEAIHMTYGANSSIMPTIALEKGETVSHISHLGPARNADVSVAKRVHWAPITYNIPHLASIECGNAM